jgi:drug/metabolite transporter (DMT)-like permease
LRRRLTSTLLALGTVTLWGASFPLTKAALDYLGPTTVALTRWVIAAVALTLWLAWKRRLPVAAQVLRRDGRTAVWVALTGITFFYFLENLALRYTTATNAGVLSNFIPIFLVLTGIVWLGERLTGAEWGALAAAFVGAAIVSQGAGHLRFVGAGLAGDLLMLAASLLGAIYSVGGKGLTARYPADVVTTVIAALGALFLLPLALIESGGVGGLTAALQALPAQAWAGLLLLGLGAGALANLWWLQLLSYTDASRAALVLFLVPVVSTALAVVWLGEPLTPTILLGAVLVLAGVVVVQQHTKGARRRTISDSQESIQEPPPHAP